MATFKLIGGRADGVLIDISVEPLPTTIKLLVPALDADGQRTTGPAEQVSYHRQQIAGSTKTFDAYLAAGLDADRMIEILLKR